MAAAPRVARYETECRGCITPIQPGELYQGYGQVYDRKKGRNINAWYHVGCLKNILAAARRVGAQSAESRRVKTRKGRR